MHPKYKKILCLIRTSFANPQYINDVVENLYTWMGESNREIISNRSQSLLTNRVVAPGDSDVPFYYQIDQHCGAFDHEVFTNSSKRMRHQLARGFDELDNAPEGQTPSLEKIQSQLLGKSPKSQI
jgi:hypothetical protein